MPRSPIEGFGEPGPEVWLAMDSIALLAAEVADIGHDFLSGQERTRLAAVRGPRDRSVFLAGRLLMRRLLARIHGGDPLVDWPLTAVADDAPSFLGQAFVRRPEAPWQMSIGQAGAYVACAVSSQRVAVALKLAEPERDVMALGEVMCSAQELLLLRDMADDERADYFLALLALDDAAVKCEAARASPQGLRRLARRDLTPKEWAASLTLAEDEAHGPLGSERAGGLLSARGWTWQGEGMALAVVAPVPARPPQWALPPPSLALPEPSSWSLQISAEPLP